MPVIVGAYGPTKEATEETQKLCDQVKSAVEEETRKVYDVYEATEYSSQIVAGEKFLNKVHVGGNMYIHLKVFRPLPCDKTPVELCGVQNMTKGDPLEPF